MFLHSTKLFQTHLLLVEQNDKNFKKMFFPKSGINPLELPIYD